jgi:hypothetical protein
MEATRIRDLYDFFEIFSTATQIELCRDMIRHCGHKSKPTLCRLFAEALSDRSTYLNIDQPFLSETGTRKVLDESSRGDNQIVFLLSARPSVNVVDAQGNLTGYRFTYRERQIGPLRIARAGWPHAGAGGIDYIASRNDNGHHVPVLGEIKRESDQNPFYAFVQLLVYLSEMATPNQIARANRHETFGSSIGDKPAFDLHILLADFNDRGDKQDLIKLTHELACGFKKELSLVEHANHVLGKILCFRLVSEEFRKSNGAVHLVWEA